MTLSKDVAVQGGLESVSKAERVASLTGIRAVAALLVTLTHAAYTTGHYTHGYLGLMYSRMEIGVPIFFVLSGFLLFGPWVKALASGGPSPSVRRYAWHRVRRIMPAYAVTVIAAYLVYHFRTAGPNPGHTWMGFLRNLSLTQIYTDHYLFSYLHQGLTQMWSLAVEVAFYGVIATLMVAPLALGDCGLYAKFLASRPMVFLGEISYEIFLIHLLTMELVMVQIVHYPIYTGSIVVVFVVTFVVTVPVAWLLHRFTRVRSR